MNSLKLITVLLIITLVVLTVVTVCLLVKNKNIIKETFFVSNHGCPPYTYDHSGKYSYLSKSKGWCATSDFGEDYYASGDADNMSQFSKSKIKCPLYYHRVPGKHSIETESKAWCVKDQ